MNLVDPHNYAITSFPSFILPEGYEESGLSRKGASNTGLILYEMVAAGNPEITDVIYAIAHEMAAVEWMEHYDVVFRMPPKRKYPVTIRVRAITRGRPVMVELSSE